MKNRSIPILGICALAAACAGRAPQPALPVAPPAPRPAQAEVESGWRTEATRADRDRLRGWRRAWMAALPRAKVANPSAVVAEGALFDPDRAMSGAMPPPGSYACRVFKLGAKGAGGLDFIGYPRFRCTVEGDGSVRRFTKLTGSQRPVGTLYSDGPGRAIFLGTLVLGDERVPLDYGIDSMRDMIGIVERVDTRRWRIALPSPHYESLIDVIELVPMG